MNLFKDGVEICDLCGYYVCDEVGLNYPTEHKGKVIIVCDTCKDECTDKNGKFNLGMYRTELDLHIQAIKKELKEYESMI